jgi:hypothetical protein
MFHNIPPLSLTNPIASTLYAHFTSQDNTLLTSFKTKPHTSPTLTHINKHTVNSLPAKHTPPSSPASLPFGKVT